MTFHLTKFAIHTFIYTVQQLLEVGCFCGELDKINVLLAGMKSQSKVVTSVGVDQTS